MDWLAWNGTEWDGLNWLEGHIRLPRRCGFLHMAGIKWHSSELDGMRLAFFVAAVTVPLEES